MKLFTHPLEASKLAKQASLGENGPTHSHHSFTVMIKKQRSNPFCILPAGHNSQFIKGGLVSTMMEVKILGTLEHVFPCIKEKWISAPPQYGKELTDSQSSLEND